MRRITRWVVPAMHEHGRRRAGQREHESDSLRPGCDDPALASTHDDAPVGFEGGNR